MTSLLRTLPRDQRSLRDRGDAEAVSRMLPLEMLPLPLQRKRPRRREIRLLTRMVRSSRRSMTPSLRSPLGAPGETGTARGARLLRESSLVARLT